MNKTYTSRKLDGLIQMSKGYRKVQLKQPWRSSAEMHPLHLSVNRAGFAAKRQSPEVRSRSSGRKVTRGSRHA